MVNLTPLENPLANPQSAILAIIIFALGVLLIVGLGLVSFLPAQPTPDEKKDKDKDKGH